MINEAFCDGLGACVGECPEGAIKIEEREAEPYDEKAVVDKMLEQGENVLRAHLEHLKDHGQSDLLEQALDRLQEKDVDISLEEFAKDQQEGVDSCPGSRMMELEDRGDEKEKSGDVPSRLGQWPVQLTLVPAQAPFFEESELLVVADCVPFAYGNFHKDFLGDNSIVVGCPKLDDAEFYSDKLGKIIVQNDLEKIKIVHMEVPCCFGLKNIVEEAVNSSGKDIDVEEVTIRVKGEIK